MLEEIYESIDGVDKATDFGQSFISSHQVSLPAFYRSKEELLLIQDLVISGSGSSMIAARYGAFIMK